MPEIDLIIFDLDGTLINSKRSIVKAVNYTLKKMGMKQKRSAEIASYIGRGEKDLLKKSLGPAGRRSFNEGYSIFKDYYRKHLDDQTVLFPHAKEVLDYFKDRKMVVLTNRRAVTARIILNRLGAGRYFRRIFGGDDENCLKPSPCSLGKVLKRFKNNRKRTILVGDMDIDVKAGKRAGVVTAAVTHGIGKIEDIKRARPDYMIDDLIELKKIVN